MQQHAQGVVYISFGNSIVLSYISFPRRHPRFQQQKYFENQLRFDAKSQWSSFYGTQCIYCKLKCSSHASNNLIIHFEPDTNVV